MLLDVCQINSLLINQKIRRLTATDFDEISR